MANKYAEKKYDTCQYLSDIVPSGLGVSAFAELERAQFNKPYFYLGIAWGGNWLRAQNSSGTVLASITSSSEFSSDFPDDRVIDGIRPHKDPLVSTWNGYWKSDTAVITEAAPQWLKMDLGIARTVNRAVIYHYYDTTYALDQFKLQSSTDGTNWTTRYQERNNNFNKSIIELPADVTARYWRLLIEKVTGSNYAIIQEIELYNVVDESENMVGNDVHAPKFTITMRRSDDDNSLPEPSAWSVDMINDDGRFLPLNESSAIYGTKQVDGKGYIRSGTLVILKGGFYDENDVLRIVGILEGQIGTEDNAAASTGIEVNTKEKQATIHGKDFTNRLSLEPIPNGLPVYESYSVEDLVRELGYLANVPYQDMVLDSTGAVISYCIFEQTTVLDQMEKLRESVQAKLYSAQDKLYMVNQIPFRNWEQTEETDFEAGVYSADCFDTTTEPGKLIPKNIDTQTEWEESGTKTKINTSGIPGSIYIAQDNKLQTLFSSGINISPDGYMPYLAQSFTPAYDCILSDYIKVYMGVAAGRSITWSIVLDNAGAPTGATVASYAYTSSYQAYGWFNIPFGNIELTGGQKYWLKVNDDTVSWGIGSTASLGGGAAYKKTGGVVAWDYSYNDFMIQVFLTPKNATLITKTIDLGANLHPNGEINIATIFPTGVTGSVAVYIEKKDADSGWGSQVLLGTNTGDASYKVATGTLKRYIRIQLVISITAISGYGLTYFSPMVWFLSWPCFYASQEHDFTALITKFGVFGSNEENPGTSFEYYVFAYAVASTAWNQALSSLATPGGQITSVIARYGKVGIGVNPEPIYPKVLDFAINWEIGSSITRSIPFSFTKTSEIEDMIYELGNPRCNYAKVKANPFILQTLSTTGVWSFNETYSLANAEVYTLDAFYTNPSIKSSGGNLRHAHVTISGTAGSVNDGSSATINGVVVAFSSGANVGTLVFTNSSGISKTIDVVTIDSRELWTAEKSGRNTQIISQDAASIILYGNKKFIREIDNSFIQTNTFAKSIADSLVLNDKYSKAYMRNIKVSFSPSMTLQDLAVITHEDIPLSGKQTLPTELVLSGDGWTSVLSSKDIA